MNTDPELSEIKQLRKKHGLTQHELAKRADVSQSLIAKIESENIDPTYSKVKQILFTLNNIEKSTELKVEQIMRRKVIYASPSDTIAKAVSVMKKNAISQLPVINKNKVEGVISESLILNFISEHPEDLANIKVGAVMDDVPPIVSKKTSVSVVQNLLKYFPIVLVSDKGSIEGVVSKADVIGNVSMGNTKIDIKLRKE
ncbi:MAG: CBS domain-containing protein [Nanoarchaeota archaeon]|nr:CBS domain-containing protein [Nanoarchaeota archaeon]